MRRSSPRRRGALAWLLLGLVVAGVGAGGFLVGRGSRRPRPESGQPMGRYTAGLEDAFAGFDGGWTFGAPYIVTLRRGGSGVTYRFARRWPMRTGVEYRVCRRTVCTRRR